MKVRRKDPATAECAQTQERRSIDRCRTRAGCIPLRSRSRNGLTTYQPGLSSSRPSERRRATRSAPTSWALCMQVGSTSRTQLTINHDFFLQCQSPRALAAEGMKPAGARGDTRTKPCHGGMLGLHTRGCGSEARVASKTALQTIPSSASSPDSARHACETHLEILGGGEVKLHSELTLVCSSPRGINRFFGGLQPGHNRTGRKGQRGAKRFILRSA